MYHPGLTTWNKVEANSNDVVFSSYETHVPSGRFYHTMNVWNNNLVIFGGAGEYIKRLKARETFNDLWLFNLIHQKWTNCRMSSPTKNGVIPWARMHHASAVINDCLLGKFL